MSILQQDEGYEEQAFKLPVFMKDWTDERKAEFAYQLLTGIPTASTSNVVSRLSTLIYRDYLSPLPYEIKRVILDWLDPVSLLRLSRVSKGWYQAIENPQLWKERCLAAGWQMNWAAIEQAQTDVQCGVEKSISSPLLPPSLPRLKPFKIPVSSHHRLAFSRSQPLLAPKGAKPLRRRNPLLPRAEARAVDWKQLYQDRARIDRRWEKGQYVLREIGASDDLQPHAGMYCLQFDGTLLVTGSRDRLIRLWDLASGKLQHTLEGHQGSVICLCFDSRYIISGGSDDAVIVWDRTRRVQRWTLQEHEDSILSVKFKEDVLITCSKDRTLRVWQLPLSGAMPTTRHVLRGHRAAVNAVQFRGDRIVSASGDKTIKIWSLSTGQCLSTLQSHSKGIACIEYDGRHIVSGSCDQTIKIWDAHTGQCLRTLYSHTELVRSLQLDLSSQRMVSGSYDGCLKIWDRSQGALVHTLSQATPGWIFSLQFDYGRIVCCSNQGKLLVYDFTKGIDTRFFL